MEFLGIPPEIPKGVSFSETADRNGIPEFYKNCSRIVHGSRADLARISPDNIINTRTLKIEIHVIRTR